MESKKIDNIRSGLQRIKKLNYSSSVALVGLSGRKKYILLRVYAISYDIGAKLDKMLIIQYVLDYGRNDT
jgi:hypothetical protein